MYGEGAGRPGLLNGVAGEATKLNESKHIAVERILLENTRDLCSRSSNPCSYHFWAC